MQTTLSYREPQERERRIREREKLIYNIAVLLGLK